MIVWINGRRDAKGWVPQDRCPPRCLKHPQTIPEVTEARDYASTKMYERTHLDTELPRAGVASRWLGPTAYLQKQDADRSWQHLDCSSSGGHCVMHSYVSCVCIFG